MIKPALPRAVIDGHFHLWNREKLPYPWLAADAAPRPFGDHSAIKPSYLPEHYRADRGDVLMEACVHVQANCADAEGEMRWLEECARDQGIPTAFVAYADLTDEAVEAALERIAASPLARGVRMMLSWHEEPLRRAASRFDLMEDGRFRAGFARLVRHGLSFDLGCLPAQLPMAAKLAADHPGAMLFLNHLGWPLLGDEDGANVWRRGMRAIAREPNVMLKVSGLWPVDRDWRVSALKPFVREAVELFGFSRCLYGSNFPIEKLMTTIPQQIAALSDIFSDASPQEREQLFAETARRVYRLPPRAAALEAAPRQGAAA